MKTFTFILSFLFFTLFTTSCSIYEDIYFQKNGGIKYSLSIDASKLLEMSSDDDNTLSFSMNGGNEDIYSGKTVNIAEMLKDSISLLTDDVLKDLENVKPLFIKLENDPENNKFNFSLYGDFENAEAFNNAFVSMGRLEKQIKEQKNNEEEPSNNISINQFFNKTELFWDKSTMKRVFENKENTEVAEEEDSDDDEDNETDEDIDDNPFSDLLNNMKIVTRYHFHKKIRKINNPDATLSKDKKTATIEYMGKPSSIEIFVK